jgi:hypothetical protein
MEAAAEEVKEVSTPKAARIDWRTGRPMVLQDAAFWKAHEVRRLEQGLSIRQYCQANGLALSTFRRRAGERGSARTRVAPATAGQRPAVTSFVAVTSPSRAGEPSGVEIETATGVRVRLAGEAAERLVQQLLAHLS